MSYTVRVEPFDMGDLRDKQRKVVEEAAECFAAVENYRMTEDGVHIVRAAYEACDVMQATLNLLAALGVSQDALDLAMESVRLHNEARGRYGR